MHLLAVAALAIAVLLGAAAAPASAGGPRRSARTGRLLPSASDAELARRAVGRPPRGGRAKVYALSDGNLGVAVTRPGGRGHDIYHVAIRSHVDQRRARGGPTLQRVGEHGFVYEHIRVHADGTRETIPRR